VRSSDRREPPPGGAHEVRRCLPVVRPGSRTGRPRTLLPRGDARRPARREAVVGDGASAVSGPRGHREDSHDRSGNRRPRHHRRPADRRTGQHRRVRGLVLLPPLRLTERVRGSARPRAGRPLPGAARRRAVPDPADVPPRLGGADHPFLHRLRGRRGGRLHAGRRRSGHRHAPAGSDGALCPGSDEVRGRRRAPVRLRTAGAPDRAARLRRGVPLRPDDAHPARRPAARRRPPRAGPDRGR